MTRSYIPITRFKQTKKRKPRQTENSTQRVSRSRPIHVVNAEGTSLTYA